LLEIGSSEIFCFLLHPGKKTSERFVFALASGVFLTKQLFSRHLILCEEKTSNMASEIQEADRLYDAHEFKQLYQYLIKLKDSDNPDILWRIVRASRDRATMAEVPADEKKYNF